MTHPRQVPAVGVIGRVRQRGGYGRTPPPVSSSIMETAVRRVKWHLRRFPSVSCCRGGTHQRLLDERRGESMGSL